MLLDITPQLSSFLRSCYGSIMKSINVKNYKEGLRDGVPIALGYLAVAFTLGIAARNFGNAVSHVPPEYADA